MADDKFTKRVSAMGDSEIKGYLNTKKEMIYKKIIWDLMNKIQKQEQPRYEKSKNEAAAKKMKRRVDDAEMESEKEKKKQRLSARINFDVLEKQNQGEEEGEDKEGGKEGESEESYGNGDGKNEVAIVGEEDDDYGNAYYGFEEDEEGCDNDEDFDYEEF